MAVTPISSNTDQLFAQFSGTDGACTNAVFLLPPSFVYPSATTFSVPLLYTGGASLPAGTSNPDFEVALQQSGTGAPSQTNVNVVVTLTGHNMWKCAPAARAELMQNFVSFLTWIETNLELPGSLIPGATMRIGQAIADNLPAPPVETLFYRYGLSPGFTAGTIPQVDIRPGMQLRIETQSTQFFDIGSPFNTYVSAGSFTYNVGSTPNANGSTRLVTFDPFLGTIAAPKISEASPVTAAGIIDLQPLGGARSYWRVIYPPTMVSPNGGGSAGTATNVTLIGATTWSALVSAAASYPSGGCAAPNVCAYFLGRAILVPQIQIFLSVRSQASIAWVPIGTTLANVIESYTAVPLQNPQNIVTLTRVSTAAPSGSSTAVVLNPSGSPPIIPAGVYDLPLIAGDTVTLTF